MAPVFLHDLLVKNMSIGRIPIKDFSGPLRYISGGNPKIELEFTDAILQQ
jgi:hypothetical protein